MPSRRGTLVNRCAARMRSCPGWNSCGRRVRCCRQGLREVELEEPGDRSRWHAIRRLADARPSLTRIAFPAKQRQILVLRVVKLAMQPVGSVRHRMPPCTCSRRCGVVASNHSPTKRKKPPANLSRSTPRASGFRPSVRNCLSIVTISIQHLVLDLATVIAAA